ncbi:uncharacterized protein [Amphiura filiformis]
MMFKIMPYSYAPRLSLIFMTFVTILHLCSGSFAIDDDGKMDQDILHDLLTGQSERTHEADRGNLSCVNHLEFAAFIQYSTARELMSEEKQDEMPAVHSFVNSNGTMKYYICRPCSTCGKGVRILVPCQSHNDTVCGTTCIDPRQMYSTRSQHCCDSSIYDVSLSSCSSPVSTTDMVPTSATIPDHVATSGIHTLESTRARDECEHTEDLKPPLKPSWVPICIATTILLIFLMAVMITVILLVQIKRNLRRPKIVSDCSESQNLQNNRIHETNTPDQFEDQVVAPIAAVSPEDRTPLRTASTTHSSYHSTDGILSKPAWNTAQTHGNPITPPTLTPDISINRIKESNLNQYVPVHAPIDQGHLRFDANNMLHPSVLDPQVTVKPGNNPYWIEMSGYFGPQGGTLSCDQSDVVLEIPPGAIPASHPRQLITVKVSLTPSIFSIEVEKGGLFLSPLVDCESPGLKRFKKDVIIKLPHRAHLRPDWQFLVHYTDDSLVVGDRGFGWRVVKSSYQNARRDIQNAAPANISRVLDVQFTVDTKYVYITTPHFSKYTCSGCGKIRELSFEAVVYIHDIHLSAERRVDLHCYLLDSIKDFQRRVDVNETFKQHTPHKPLIIDAKKGKELDVSLVDMGEDWKWKIDERIHKATQVVNVDDLVRCHSDLVPDFTTFTLRPRHSGIIGEQQSPSSCLETHVNIKQKSRAKGITIDIAIDLDGSSIHETRGTREEMEVGLMEAFLALSNKLTATQWKPLFRTLMTTATGYPMNVEAKISFIENKDPNDLKEQIYNGLMEWYRMCGKYVTIQKLCSGLQKEQLESVAAEINDVYHQASVKVRAKSKLEKKSHSLETTV